MLRRHRWLTFGAISLIGLLAANILGLLLDPRVITGSPAWLKPAKFAISGVLYLGTFAWILNKVTIWPRFVTLMGQITTAMIAIELIIIDLQAWRGITSHFNFTTPLNAVLFGTMGLSIAILWLASVGIAYALFRQHFDNRPFGWALRLGVVITVLGSASGGLMTRAMPGQSLSSATIGSHTVGAPDGGPGVPLTNWSSKHGDLRIGHFFGLHGMQAIPLLYWLLLRRRKATSASVAISAASYLAAAILLEAQALRGQSILQPDGLTLTCWSLWLITSAGAFLWQSSPRQKGNFLSAAGVA